MGKKKVKVQDGKNSKKQPVNLSNLEEADTNSTDFDKLVKNEYQRLLRQYRLMEDERHSVAAKGNALSKQARLLDLLYEEVKDINTDLYNVDSKRNQDIDKKTSRSVLHMIEEIEAAQKEEEFCLKNIREMCTHVHRIIKNLIAHKLKVQAVYGNSKSYGQIEKRRRVLENRLHFYTTKYCMKIHDNKLIRRDEINLTLKLRALFHSRYMSLKRQLQTVRGKMGEIVFLATQAYDQHDDLLASIRLIRERNDKDNRQHVLEMKEFKRIIQHDAVIRAFLVRKSFPRNVHESRSQRTNRKNQSRLNSLNLQLGKYQRSFRRILVSSKYNTLEHLIRKYNDTMQSNFATFRINCDLNHEIMALRMDSLEMAERIEALYAESKEQDLKNEEVLQEARLKLFVLNTQLGALQETLIKAEANMKETLRILQNLFTLIGCSTSSVARFLGNTDGIKPENAFTCAQLIDMRIHELTAQKALLEYRRDVEVLNVTPKKDTRLLETDSKRKTSGGPYLPSVVVSAHMEEGEEDDDELLNITPNAAEDIRFTIMERLRVKNATIISTRDYRSSSASNYLGSKASGISVVAPEKNPAASPPNPPSRKNSVTPPPPPPPPEPVQSEQPPPPPKTTPNPDPPPTRTSAQPDDDDDDEAADD